jgi:hypothetical protein
VQLALVEVNGGFPEPPAGARVRVVSARHSACGETTRLRLPEGLPAKAVRRVVCEGCAEPFESPAVEEIGLESGPFPRFEAATARTLQIEMPTAAPAPLPSASRRSLPHLALPHFSVPHFSLPHLTLPRLAVPQFSLPQFSPPRFSPPQFSGPAFSLPRLSLPDPAGRAWRYLSIPVAAAAVIGVLLLVQGSNDHQISATPAAAAKQHAAAPAAVGAHANAAAGDGAAKHGSGSASFVRESTFSLALPRGWQKTTPAAGAAFAASAPGGTADATLWIERDSSLDFPSFEARSIAQLRELAGSAHIVDRVAAPTPDASVVKLAADAPPNTPRYEVTLRASGPYRYYLATTLQPSAPGEAADGVDLIHSSFLPQGAK